VKGISTSEEKISEEKEGLMILHSWQPPVAVRTIQRKIDIKAVPTSAARAQTEEKAVPNKCPAAPCAAR